VLKINKKSLYYELGFKFNNLFKMQVTKSAEEVKTAKGKEAVDPNPVIFPQTAKHSEAVDDGDVEPILQQERLEC
jgi:hypothetical protein